MAEALEADDLPAFLQNVTESGRSSAMYLQNIYATDKSEEMALALFNFQAAFRSFRLKAGLRTGDSSRGRLVRQ